MKLQMFCRIPVIMQGKSVAVVSGNNAAVQNVKDKLEKEQYGFFQLISAIRKIERLSLRSCPCMM